MTVHVVAKHQARDAFARSTGETPKQQEQNLGCPKLRAQQAEQQQQQQPQM